jgi:hypothetical protein
MAPDSGEPDAAALRDRVADLEQTVANQQATIDSLAAPTASRRGVLAALTGVAGAGALGAYSQRASAQAAGQVGTQSEPVDVEAWDLTVQNQLAADLDAGGNSLTNVGAVEAEEAIIANTAARANLSANQTIPTDTVTALDLDGVGFEDETIADVQLSNNYIQVQADGKYHISGAIRWSPSPDWSLGDVINIRLYASGAEIARVSGQHTGVDSALSQTVSISESLTNGDAIEIRVRQGSGGGKEIAGFSNANYLSVARIG